MPVTRVCTNQTYAKSRVCPPLPGGKTLEPGLFPGSAQERCELREPPLRPLARLRFATPFGGAARRRRGLRDEVQGIARHGDAQRQLRRLLLSSEHALRAGAREALPDLPAQPPGGPAAAAADAFRLPPGAPPPGRVGVPERGEAGRAARLSHAPPAADTVRARSRRGGVCAGHSAREVAGMAGRRRRVLRLSDRGGG